MHVFWHTLIIRNVVYFTAAVRWPQKKGSLVSPYGIDHMFGGGGWRGRGCCYCCYSNNVVRDGQTLVLSEKRSGYAGFAAVLWQCGMMMEGEWGRELSRSLVGIGTSWLSHVGCGVTTSRTVTDIDQYRMEKCIEAKSF